MIFDLDTGATQAAAASAQSVSFAYNSANNTYSVASQGRTASFSAADLLRENTNERVFRTVNGDRSEFLTLVDRGYESNSIAKYVRIAYWQSNVRNGRDQETLLEVFPYGFPSLPANVPTTGAFDFGIDLFGLTTQDGIDPLAFSGSGTMIVDLQRGTFSLNGSFSEFYFTTGDSRTGALDLTAAGTISSSSRMLDGRFSYDNLRGGLAGLVTGRFTGTFYGPAGQEAGGTLIGTAGNADNTTTVSGAWAAINNGATRENVIVSDLRKSALFLGPNNSLTFAVQDNPATPAGTPSTQLYNRQFSYDREAGTLRLSGIGDDGVFSITDLVPVSGSAFSTYERTRGDHRYQLQLYRPDIGGLIDLTYLSFARYTHETRFVGATLFNRDHLVYGIETLEGVLEGRTGTATYRGIALGNGVDTSVTSRLDLNGTAQFDVNFGADTLNGWVDLTASEQGSGRGLNFGRFVVDHSGSFSRSNVLSTILVDTADRSRGGTLGLRFYGPNAEELGGAFELFADDYLLGGVVLTAQE